MKSGPRGQVWGIYLEAIPFITAILTLNARKFYIGFAYKHLLRSTCSQIIAFSHKDREPKCPHGSCTVCHLFLVQSPLPSSPCLGLQHFLKGISSFFICPASELYPIKQPPLAADNKADVSKAKEQKVKAVKSKTKL